jgi:hypothetical protein
MENPSDSEFVDPRFDDADLPTDDELESMRSEINEFENRIYQNSIKQD